MCDTPDSFRIRSNEDENKIEQTKEIALESEEETSSNGSYESACSSLSEPNCNDVIDASKTGLALLDLSSYSETDAKPSASNTPEAENKLWEPVASTSNQSVNKSISPKQRIRRQSAVELRSPVVEIKSPVLDRHAEEYNMNFKRRGTALILNHMKFDTEDYRKGSEIDCKRLKKTLRTLGFDVRVEENLNYIDLATTLQNLSREDHSLSDCLLVAVMTHGLQGELYARDHTYPTDRLWSYFTADKCPSLAGKPKIFIIQACRGQKIDSGTVVSDAVDSATATTRYTIPNQADIIIANSTVEGFYAWRNPLEGSWFIKSLCEELQLHSENRDLATILTFVCRRVAIDYESVVPHMQSMHEKKQVPCILSMLTRLIYLRKKN